MSFNWNDKRTFLSFETRISFHSCEFYVNRYVNEHVHEIPSIVICTHITCVDLHIITRASISKIFYFISHSYFVCMQES